MKAVRIPTVTAPRDLDWVIDFLAELLCDLTAYQRAMRQGHAEDLSYLELQRPLPLEPGATCPPGTFSDADIPF